MIYELGTFRSFVKADFDPVAFTSDIIQGNSSSAQGMDIDMCLKMLTMYLETIDSDLREVVVQNQEKLFSQVQNIRGMKTEYDRIFSQVDTITTTFESIKGEVSTSCRLINENAIRLANFNNVILLLRQVSQFRTGIKKIKGFLSDSNPTERSWLRAQKTFQEIEKVFIEGKLSRFILLFC